MSRLNTLTALCSLLVLFSCGEKKEKNKKALIGYKYVCKAPASVTAPEDDALELFAMAPPGKLEEPFFSVPAISSANGKLSTDLYLSYQNYTLGGNNLRLRSYSPYPDRPMDEPIGPVLRVKPNDRLSVTIHNNFPVEEESNYLYFLSTDLKPELSKSTVSGTLNKALVAARADEAKLRVNTNPALLGPSDFTDAKLSPMVGYTDRWEIVVFSIDTVAHTYDSTVVEVREQDNVMLGTKVLMCYEHIGHIDNHNIPHMFNTTNLHTHGFHVSPYQDDIFRQVPPTFGSYYTYDLNNHTAGTMWYHPHIHGSTSVQVASGMSSALVIEDDFSPSDRVKYKDLVAANEHEQIFMFDQVRWHPKTGELHDFNVLAWLRNDPAMDAQQGTTVNGRIRPNASIAPGEVQRWRLLHKGFSSAIAVALPDGLEAWQIAVDGIMFDEPRRIYSIHMAPGNRMDLLVQVSDSLLGDTLHLASTNYIYNCEYFPEDAECKAAVEVKHTLLDLVVEGAPQAMTMPTILPGPTMPMHADVTFNNPDYPRGKDRKTKFSIDIVGGRTQFRINGAEFEGDIVNETLVLNTEEQWKLTAEAGPHPYHIHINPFQVWTIADRDLEKPIWKDVVLVPPGPNGDTLPVTYIRSRYTEYTGDFVMHCHILPHEDQGMMQRISIVDGPTSSAPVP